jgi:hypothetical protein
MADDEMDGQPADNAAGMATAMIVVTTLLLLGAFIVMNGIAATHYGKGLF